MTMSRQRARLTKKKWQKTFCPLIKVKNCILNRIKRISTKREPKRFDPTN